VVWDPSLAAGVESPAHGSCVDTRDDRPSSGMTGKEAEASESKPGVEGGVGAAGCGV